MTQPDHAQPEIPTGSHPFVCPRCERRTGIVDLGRGVSTCFACGLEWRGPRLVRTQPPTGEAEQAAWAEAVVKDVLRDQ